VFRPENPDYGIDGEVEIFDKDGNSTGYRFHAQLKATDAKDEASAKSVVLRRDTAAYYSSLDLPVLIVSYHAPTGTLYARWYHEFDPYYGGLGEKSITFGFLDKDRWTDATPEKLLRDLKRRRQVRDGMFPRPIPVFLSIGTDRIGSVPIQSLKNGLSKAFERLREVVVLSDSDREAVAVIEVGRDAIAVNLGSEIRLTLHANEKIRDPHVLAHDILLGLALAFGKARHSGLTAQIASVAADLSSMIRTPEVFGRLAMQLASGRRILEALGLSEKLAARFGPDWASEALRLPALAALHQLSSAEREFYQRHLERRVGLAEQSGVARQVAIARYNLGNFFRAIRDRREGVRQYIAAARTDPDYWERDYFCSELGGMLFELHRFKCAVRCYERSLERGAGEQVKPLLADALMFAGQYKRAQRLFDEHLKATGDLSAEWRLKEWALATIVQELEMTEQKRETERARQLAGDLERLKGEPHRVLGDAFQADALSGLAWFNKGASCLERGDHREAGLAYVIAALCQPWDIVAWVNAYALAKKDDELKALTALVLVAGHAAHGERLLQAIANSVKGPPEAADAYAHELRELLKTLPKPPVPIEIRMVGPEGAYFSWDLASGELRRKDSATTKPVSVPPRDPPKD
jgi:tetratricopeptide (TPR) repeat protein